MPSSEPDIFDTLLSSAFSLSNELIKYAQTLGDYSQDAADKLEKGFDSYADTIRQSMRDQNWIPESIKPPAPRPLPSSHIQLGIFSRCTTWINENRAISAAAICFLGTSLFLVYRHRRISRRKRRARRAQSGAKTEVVVLAGSPYAHVTKSIAQDLEKRGFMIYIPVGSLEEEAAVAELRVANIHALNFDITSRESTTGTIEKLSELLHHPNRHGTDRLHLASLVVVESFPSTLETSSITGTSSLSWSDALNSRVLYPITMIHAFLPLLVSESMAEDISQPTTIVVVTPSNVSSINAPYHARESTTTAALTSYIKSLRMELPSSITITHVRMGSFATLPTHFGKFDMALARIKKFTASARSASKSASPSPSRSISKTEEPSPTSPGLSKLHHGIFDAVVGRTSGTVFLGRGALMYALVGAFAPTSLVSWMVGYHRRTRTERQ